MKREIQITISAKTDLEVHQIKTALESISLRFKPSELALIAKKLELPVVQMKIRSML
jgi:hypothetical protein